VREKIFGEQRTKFPSRLSSHALLSHHAPDAVRTGVFWMDHWLPSLFPSEFKNKFALGAARKTMSRQTLLQKPCAQFPSSDEVSEGLNGREGFGDFIWPLIPGALTMVGIRSPCFEVPVVGSKERKITVEILSWRLRRRHAWPTVSLSMIAIKSISRKPHCLTILLFGGCVLIPCKCFLICWRECKELLTISRVAFFEPLCTTSLSLISW